MGKNYEFNLKNESYTMALTTAKILRKVYKDSFLRIYINQALASSSSVGANIHEANCSKTGREFIRYHEIALKSGNETLYWFSLLEELSPEIAPELSKIRLNLEKITRVTASCIIKLRQKPCYK